MRTLEPHNMTERELERQAYLTDNKLALAIIDADLSELDEEYSSDDRYLAGVNFMYNLMKLKEENWVPCASHKKEVAYVCCPSDDISISISRQRSSDEWKVNVENNIGVDLHFTIKGIVGFKKAQQATIEILANKLCMGELEL